MGTRVRPSILFGGTGLLIGFILGVITVNLASFDDEEPATERVVRPVHPRRAPAAAAELPDTAVHTVITAGRPALGPDSARVTVVEFTDYECPVCRRHFTNTLPLVLAQYGNRIRYVILNLPLSRIHPDALGAAEAAECAADQNRFWEYHDRLYLSSALDRAALLGIAAQMHLDGAAFARCVDTQATAERVRGHLAQADSLGVHGTPTFVINGRLFTGGYSFTDLKILIDDALAEAQH